MLQELNPDVKGDWVHQKAEAFVATQDLKGFSLIIAADISNVRYNK